MSNYTLEGITAAIARGQSMRQYRTSRNGQRTSAIKTSSTC